MSWKKNATCEPEGYRNCEYTNRVLRLNKAIYGLKQSGKAWNFKIDCILMQFDFKSMQNEPCLYIKNINEGIIFIAAYVDDIIGIHYSFLHYRILIFSSKLKQVK